MSNLKKWGGVLALCMLVAVALAATYRIREQREVTGRMAATRKASTASTLPATSTASATNIDAFNAGSDVKTPARNSADASDGRGTYIVVLGDEPLATYKGSLAGFSAPPRRMGAYGKYKLDTRSSESLRYLSYLQRRQGQMEQQMSSALLRSLPVRRRMQHAINAIVTDLTPTEAGVVSRLGGVRLVEQYREYALDTDVGPTLIGAPVAWAGSVGEYYNSASPVKGEGIVVGIIDSGINFGSPSFAATDPIDGYVHVNPLGAGVYLGTCAAGGVDEGRCNSKLIGGYDFVCNAPGNTCGTANVREEPGFGDTNGHGSHTASTVAGNRRDVVFSGAPLRISGVAPRANIIAYDACYTNTSTSQGLCPNVSTVAAINQAIADGVDVINYSIGGGAEPWAESTSLAFLNAVDAGVYVAASAGNSGPAPNTLGHLEPWVASTAAAQHGRGDFALLMQVTGPAPVPPALQPLVLTNGNSGVELTATIPGTTPLRVSAGIDAADDGCNAYAPDTFAGAIAVIRRGSCSFSIKVNNASAAGALAVVIANNQAGLISPTVPGTTIPVFAVLQTEGNALRDFVAAHPTATAQISFPAVGLPNVADALGSFSSRGPAGRFSLVKPDLTAPGVNILATIAGTTITGSENLIGLMSGTSMASPHHAGAAALVRQARPGWTMPEIQSALMMTATPTVYKEDQVTLADPFARGAGRIRVDRAIRAGLVLGETTANFQAANPDNGGNPTTLNVASLGNAKCFPTCSFTRTFRNPGTSIGLWRISISGVPGTANPSLMWVLPGATRSVTFTINSATLPGDGSWNFGQVLMEYRESGGGVNDYASLRMPIAVSVPPPVVSVPASVSASTTAGNNGSANFNIGNVGGSTLNYTASGTGNGVVTPYLAQRGAVNSGFRNTSYNPAQPTSQGEFAADDFNVLESTRITSLTTEGFVVSGVALTSAATSITWSLYPDASGVPAGNPQTGAAAAVWTYTATPTAAGVSTSTNAITLNLVAAGQNVTLTPGKYWLVVNTRGTFANRWAQFGSATGSGSFASIIIDQNGAGNWASNAAFAGLSMVVKGTVACGAPWFGALTPASGAVAPGASQPTTLALNSSALAAASYRANVCVSSNDPVSPVVAVPIVLTVSPAP
jgi:hypothetical protein